MPAGPTGPRAAALTPCFTAKLLRSWPPAGRPQGVGGVILSPGDQCPPCKCHTCTCDQTLAAGLGSAHHPPLGRIPAQPPTPSQVSELHPGLWSHPQSSRPPWLPSPGAAASVGSAPRSRRPLDAAAGSGVHAAECRCSPAGEGVRSAGHLAPLGLVLSTAADAVVGGSSSPGSCGGPCPGPPTPFPSVPCTRL